MTPEAARILDRFEYKQKRKLFVIKLDKMARAFNAQGMSFDVMMGRMARYRRFLKWKYNLGRV